MRSETIPRGGCRFIAGDPRDIHTDGLAIFCGKPVADRSWCREHEAIVFLTPEALVATRKAA